MELVIGMSVTVCWSVEASAYSDMCFWVMVVVCMWVSFRFGTVVLQILFETFYKFIFVTRSLFLVVGNGSVGIISI